MPPKLMLMHCDHRIHRNDACMILCKTEYYFSFQTLQRLVLLAFIVLSLHHNNTSEFTVSKLTSIAPQPCKVSLNIQEEVVTYIHLQLMLQPKHKIKATYYNVFNSDLLETNLSIRTINKWFDPDTPYFVHDTTKAPNITSRRVLVEANSFRGCPFDRYFTTV